MISRPTGPYEQNFPQKPRKPNFEKPALEKPGVLTIPSGTPPTPEELSAGKLEQMLIQDNLAMREAGCELAEAALRVARTHDGCHRLMLAVAKWARVIANESGRGEAHKGEQP